MQKIGVIDIGSNSVRLVIYDGLKRVPLPLFNEKVLCGLARGMAETGKLNPKGVEMAEKAIRRFKLLSDNMGVKNLYAVATSAVRDATDGKNFKARVEKENDIKINIISGEEEARFSTLGVQSSVYAAEGVVGDLGGGSIEFSYIRNKNNGIPEIGGFASFPIGPLRLKVKTKKDFSKATKIIDAALKSASTEFIGKDFYAVGGGFRTLAKIHLTRFNYPLKILHNYSVKSEDLKKTITSILKMSTLQLQKLAAISENRLETLKYTALIASRIMEIFKSKNFVFSVHGLREGFLYDLLKKDEKLEDPLIACCIDMIDHISPEKKGEWPKLGHELFEWMSPLFKDELKEISRLRLACCILNRLVWYEHIEYRAEMAFRMILDSEISGITHRHRVFIAACLYHRYKTAADKDTAAKMKSVLSNNLISQAKKIGLAMRLGMSICGGAPSLLPHAEISINSGKIVIDCKKIGNELVSESVIKRLIKLAEFMNLTYKII